jgi:hypothetical protein
MKGEAYASDVSTDLQLDYELVCKIMDDPGVGRQDGAYLMLGYEIGDSIHGHRIIAEARKVSDPVVIVKSTRHKAQG